MPPATSVASFRRYLWTAGLAALLMLTGIVTMNYLVDPYFIHQWDSSLLKRLSPAQQRITPWSKTYAVYRYRPEVVFLGSSRAEIGLPPDPDLFPGKRVFNLAVKGGTLGDAVAMLHHTSQFQRPELVVWGLEYGWLFRDGIGNTDFDRRLVAERAATYPLWRTLVNLKRDLSLDMTEDSLTILAGSGERSCLPLVAYHGNKPTDCVSRIMVSEGGTAKAFAALMKEGESKATPADLTAIDLLTKTMQGYCRTGTKFRLFIQPTHALDQLRFYDQWQEVEHWERSLVAAVDQSRQQGCDVRLLDFSGFNRITTEEIPQTTGKDEMRYYWEASHYRSEVGRELLTKLLAASPPAAADDFGVELSGALIEPHLRQMREGRDRYCASHPDETRALRGLAGAGEAQ